MELSRRIEAFATLGKYLLAAADGSEAHPAPRKLQEAALHAEVRNPWFTARNISLAYRSWGEALQLAPLQRWCAAYPRLAEEHSPKRVAVVMAGNIPLVGLHDLLSVLVAGHRLLAKLSTKDTVLMQAVIDLLLEIEPAFAQRIDLTEGLLKDFDAVIATGSDNSSRYFDYYFAKYPHIIRGNRHTVAILRGDESDAELATLATDVFAYFGLGCRNVSKLFVPQGFDVLRLFRAFESWDHLAQHNKYLNNFDYNRAIFLMNRIEFLSSGFLIIREDVALASPISVLHFQRYKDLKAVHAQLAEQSQQLQCIVGKRDMHPKAVALGHAQMPQLWDYADEVDTLAFLQEIAQ